MVCVPSPTATHMFPFQTTPLPDVVKGVPGDVVPRPVQVIPSFEYAIVFVPCPTATQIFKILGPNV